MQHISGNTYHITDIGNVNNITVTYWEYPYNGFDTLRNKNMQSIFCDLAMFFPAIDRCFSSDSISKYLYSVTITEHFSGEVFGGISFFLTLVLLPTNK